MKSVPEFGSRIKALEDSVKVPKKARTNVSQNRLNGLIFCPFCGSLATFLAIRKDGKTTPCCANCASYAKEETSQFRRLMQG